MRAKIIVYIFFMLTALLTSIESKAEYGDVVLNTYAEASGMKPVIFPHWFHRIRFTCKVCHSDLGFKMKAGANNIKMMEIMEGQYCGNCHNGEVAWGIENCDLCHSGRTDVMTRVERSSLQKLLNVDLNPNQKAE
ncbi:MAG: hypothetical protein OQK32_04945 [Gammaproteobacteria bacterium]|nr:hypothetical protein [Gammaproteobacteria bacterium]